MFKQYPDVVTIAQLQTMLGIGRTGAYRLIKSGEIKSVRVGRIYKIPKANIIKYLKQTV